MIFTIIQSLLPILIQILSYEFFYTKIHKKEEINIKPIILLFSLALIVSFFYSLFLFLPQSGKIFRDIFYYIFLFIQPFIFYKYFLKQYGYKKYLTAFLALAVYLSVETSETFFSVIISSVTGDYFVKQHYDMFYTLINLLSLFTILKVVDFFNFYFEYYKEKIFKKDIYSITKSYILIHILLLISHILSEVAHLNSFASMIATICFILFLSSLFYLKSVRERYEKIKEIKQKEKEQRQLQLYTDEIVQLYNEIRGFRHDYAILYIETAGGPYKLRIVGKNFLKEFYGTIAEIQERDLEHGNFFSPHKSYLSNIRNINGYDKKTKEVLYYDGHRSPISRLRVRYLKEILKTKNKEKKKQEGQISSSDYSS